MHRVTAVLLAATFALAGCGRSGLFGLAAKPDGGAHDAGTTDAGGTSCPSSVTSTIRGAHLVIPEQPCRFTLAQARAGITFHWQLVVDAQTDSLTPEHRNCTQAVPPELAVEQQISGGGQTYCFCDCGLPAPGSPPPVTLAPHDYDNSFAWTGRNWFGPSDFGAPLGEPFPPGDYTFTVEGHGTAQAADGSTQPYAITGTFPFTLVP